MEGASVTPTLQRGKLNPEMTDNLSAQAHTENAAVGLGLTFGSGYFQSLCFTPTFPSLLQPSPPPHPQQGLSLCSLLLERGARAKAASEFHLSG